MEIKQIQIRSEPPPIIPTIEPPVTRRTEQTLIPQIDMPIINMPDTTVKYPVIDVPTQEEFDAAVRAERKKQEESQEEKSRGLPDTTPPPQLPQVVQPPQDTRIISDQPTANTNLGVPVIEVPIVGEIPVPPKEQVILAGTTATASVAAALVGKSLVEWMVKKMKPALEQIFVRGKKILNKDLTPYETQVYFAFEKSVSLKKVNKLLKKEQKVEKKQQYKKFHSK